MKKKRTYYPGASTKENRVRKACYSLTEQGFTEITVDTVLDEMKRLSIAADFTRAEAQRFMRFAEYLDKVRTKTEYQYKGYSRLLVTTYRVKT
jgi:hypothetical protein